jgi:cytochrome o ubiquinol oxidase subunit 2
LGEPRALEHGRQNTIRRDAAPMSQAAACRVLCAPSFLDGLGPSSAQTASLFWIVLAAMLIVVLPVLVLTPLIAWRYRLRGDAAYTPRWDSSRILELIVWSVPVAIVLCLSVLLWNATHRLDPYRVIAGHGAPLDVQVVGMDWKWLFLYPDQKIATVNVLVVPAGRPVRLHLTSATVMQSFMIPQLGGQIYAMAGMTTQLNVLANRRGAFLGQNTQFNGPGFPKQRLQLLAVSLPTFDRFVARAQASRRRLDAVRYEMLTRQSSIDQPLLFSAPPPDLFGRIVRQGSRTSGASR